MNTSPAIEPRSSFARTARLAAERLGLSFEFIDNEGYLFSVGRAGRSVVLGSGACSPFVQNSAKAYTLCRDKAYTTLLLDRAGLPTIPFQLYFTNDRRAAWRAPGREISDLMARVRTDGFPVFAKPNLGSRGEYAEQIDSPEALADWLGRVGAEHESILIQPVIAGAEYRVFILDGEAIFSYRKEADGPGPANLARGGEVRGFTDQPPPALAAMALAAARAMDLRLAGIDLFDTTRPGEEPSFKIIEVNANPNFESLERVGREDLILRIWSATFDAALGPA